MRILNLLMKSENGSKYPWLTLQFFRDLLQTMFYSNSNGWASNLNGLPKPHGFIILPLQSGFGGEDSSDNNSKGKGKEKESPDEDTNKEKSEHRDLLEKIIFDLHDMRSGSHMSCRDLSHRMIQHQNVDVFNRLTDLESDEVVVISNLRIEKGNKLCNETTQLVRDNVSESSETYKRNKDETVDNLVKSATDPDSIIQNANVAMPQAYHQLKQELRESSDLYKDATDALNKALEIKKCLEDETDDGNNNKNSKDDSDDDDPKGGGSGLAGPSSTGDNGTSGPSSSAFGPSASHRSVIDWLEIISCNLYLLFVGMLDGLEILINNQIFM